MIKHSNTSPLPEECLCDVCGEKTFLLKDFTKEFPEGFLSKQ